MKAPQSVVHVEAILAQLRPMMPPEVRVEVRPGKRLLGLQQVRDGDIRIGPLAMHVPTGPDDLGGKRGLVWCPGFGPWVPFLPRKLRARLTAQDLVETLLDVVFEHLEPPTTQTDFAVRCVVEGDNVIVSYVPPGAEPAARATLAPIPVNRLQ